MRGTPWHPYDLSEVNRNAHAFRRRPLIETASNERIEVCDDVLPVPFHTGMNSVAQEDAILKARLCLIKPKDRSGGAIPDQAPRWKRKSKEILPKGNVPRTSLFIVPGDVA